MRNQKAPIAVEGYPFIAVAAGLTGLFFFISWAIPAAVAFAATLFIAFFFRNPKRTIPHNKKAILAPADGVVIYLGSAREAHLGCEMTKISIFMSVFNVHVNRAPLTGTVVDRFYVKGKFLDVRDERSTFENEQNGLIIETLQGVKVVVVQVAGLIARRIVCYPAIGSRLERGQIYGLIRFGSRLDVFLPKEAVVGLSLGDRTVAGETVLGMLP
ncbi:phosphatidylserine decarboxylase family protein [Geobacter sp. DSM 9736]|uniref:phosphatidylserine decarboxylase family protein n=1 Tax=Geobacter sp. DSM 9736 TaxID=1277350 RepID=UPI000B5015B8|nr:phosphatidylserine decarboxylase family protein [Geobacter sp. DSM 9736]SNB46383.1 phosphatidylserine decarboxylase [Geobacter sp. DSM 9736]